LDVSHAAWGSAVAQGSHRLAVLLSPEVLVHALALDSPERGVDVADHVLSHADEAPTAAVDLARQVHRRVFPHDSIELPVRSGPEDLAVAREQVGGLRARLAKNPHNPVGWVDLARAHTITGSTDKAHRAITVALEGGSGNRFILRSAARFFVHQGDLERALHVLEGCGTSLSDPWLLASELAVAHLSGAPPRSTRSARRFADDRAFSAFERSELLSAIATLELASGNDKRARKLFDASLKEPHENSLAQAEWASERAALVRVPQELLGTPESYEARTRDATGRGDWKEALEQSLYWQHAEPFSAEAAIHSSYVAGVGLGDYRASLEAAEQGLLANPHNPVLRNNVAYAAANLGKLHEAVLELEQMRALIDEPRLRVPYFATSGLVAYRMGDHDRGRDLYRRAIAASRSLPDGAGLEPLIWAHFAREELLADGDEREEIAERAHQAAQGWQAPDLLALLSRLDALRDSGGTASRLEG
jgi:hypothetical protein